MINPKCSMKKLIFTETKIIQDSNSKEDYNKNFRLIDKKNNLYPYLNGSCFIVCG